MIEMPPIPDFLIATVENTRAARASWKPCRVRSSKAKRASFHLPKSIEPAGLAMLKEAQREKIAREKARKHKRKRPPARKQAAQVKGGNAQGGHR